MLRRKKGPFNHGINKKAKQTIKTQEGREEEMRNERQEKEKKKKKKKKRRKARIDS